MATFGQRWDAAAKLSSTQRKTVEVVKGLGADRPLPSDLPEGLAGDAFDVADQRSSPDVPSASDAASGDGGEGTIEADTTPSPSSVAAAPSATRAMVESVLSTNRIDTVQDFHAWFAAVQREVEEEQEEQYSAYLATIRGYDGECRAMLTTAEEVRLLLATIKERHAIVASKTESLYEACEALVMEKNRLATTGESMRSRLAYFSELEPITRLLHSGKVDVHSQRFLQTLTRLDECIGYISANQHFMDAPAYLLRFRTLQNRGLTLIKSEVVSRLKAATDAVLAQAASDAQSAGNDEAVDAQTAAARERRAGGRRKAIPSISVASAAYVHFRGIAPELASLLRNIEHRAARPEYASLLRSCQRVYYDQRLTLLGGGIDAHVSSLASIKELIDRTRAGADFMLGVVEHEYELYTHFFAAPDAGIGADFVEGLSLPLYESLRPLFIQEDGLSVLCDICALFKSMLSRDVVEKGASAAGFVPVLRAMLGDVQERLIFRALIYIQDNITAFTPTQAELDYPALLTAVADGSAAPGVTEVYPTLDRTLTMLSKLFHAVDVRTFEGLACEFVSECTSSLRYASKQVGRRDALDGLLFIIKHLLLLRAQISPFNVDFLVTQKALDFTAMPSAWSKLVKGGIFSLSADNPVVGIFSAPKVVEQRVDSKKLIESDLKRSCEEFVRLVLAILAPISEFLDRVIASSSMLRGGTAASGSLRDQPFMEPSVVRTAVQAATRALDERLPEIIARMALYLRNTATHAILYQPVRKSVLDLYYRLDAVLQEEYEAGDRDVIGAPTPAAIASRLEAFNELAFEGSGGPSTSAATSHAGAAGASRSKERSSDGDGGTPLPLHPVTPGGIQVDLGPVQTPVGRERLTDEAGHTPFAASAAADDDAEGMATTVLEPAPHHSSSSEALEPVTAPRFDGDLSSDGSTGADAPLPIPSVELRALGDDMFRAEVGQALSGTVFKMTTLIGGGVGSGGISGAEAANLDDSAKALLAKMALYQSSLQSMPGEPGGDLSGGGEGVSGVTADVEALIAKAEAFLAGPNVIDETRAELRLLLARLQQQAEGFAKVQAPSVERSVTVADAGPDGDGGRGTYALHLVHGETSTDALRSFRDVINLRQVLVDHLGATVAAEFLSEAPPADTVAGVQAFLSAVVGHLVMFRSVYVDDFFGEAGFWREIYGDGDAKVDAVLAEIDARASGQEHGAAAGEAPAVDAPEKKKRRKRRKKDKGKDNGEGE